MASSNSSVVATVGFHGGAIRSSYAESSLFSPSSQTTESASRRNVHRSTRTSRRVAAWDPAVAHIVISANCCGKLSTTSIFDAFSRKRGAPRGGPCLKFEQPDWSLTRLMTALGASPALSGPEDGEQLQRIHARAAGPHSPVEMRTGD